MDNHGHQAFLGSCDKKLLKATKMYLYVIDRYVLLVNTTTSAFEKESTLNRDIIMRQDHIISQQHDFIRTLFVKLACLAIFASVLAIVLTIVFSFKIGSFLNNASGKKTNKGMSSKDSD